MKCMHLFCRENFEIKWVMVFRFTSCMTVWGIYTSLQMNTALCGKVAHSRYIEGFLKG